MIPVAIRSDGVPGDWQEFFALADAASIPDDFLAEREPPPPAPRPELDTLFEDDETS